MTEKPHILIATPCYGGQLTLAYHRSVLDLMIDKTNYFGSISFHHLPGDALITRARNTQVAAFLHEPKFTHLVFIDADIGFTPGQLIRLFQWNKDLVGGIYPTKVIDWAAVARNAQASPQRLLERSARYVFDPFLDQDGQGTATAVDGFAKVRAVGTGFLVIKRAVFEALRTAHAELKIREPFNAAMPVDDDGLYAFFDCLIDPETRAYLPEDFAFCQRCRALGYDIWADLHSQFTHTGTFEFQGDFTTQWSNPL
ncbi:MAG: hypothetical protein P4L10_00260 [Acidobacteriaceae bacterium]|nr:hypothetical protein [Acidobacteriaceae bacterium]